MKTGTKFEVFWLIQRLLTMNLDRAASDLNHPHKLIEENRSVKFVQGLLASSPFSLIKTLQFLVHVASMLFAFFRHRAL